MDGSSSYKIESWDSGDSIQYDIKCEERLITTVDNLIEAEQIIGELQALESEIRDLKEGEEYCNENHL